MSIERIQAVFCRQLFLYKGNPTRLAGIFLWLVIDIIQWGFISKYLGSFGGTTLYFTTFILGAIILWEFMTRVQQGIMTAFLEDIWSQNLINYFASPLRISEYLGGLVLTSLTTSLAGFVIMVIIAGTGFNYSIFRIGHLLVPSMAILLVFGTAMGFFVSAMVFRLGPSAEWLGWPIPLVLSLFAGVFYPVSVLPIGLRAVTVMIPPTYVFENMRYYVMTGSYPPNLLPSLIFGGLLALLYLFLTFQFFITIYGKNLKTGSIARFNAEAL